MKKKWLTFLLALTCGCFSAGFIACSEEEHTHDGTAYATDAENHWYECTCGEIHSVAAHEWDEGEVTTEATCSAAGEKTYTCTVCAQTKTETVDAGTHTYATYEKSAEGHIGVCACGAKQALAAHEWDEGTVTTAATCSTAGVKTYTCTVCEQTKAESVEEIAHSYVSYKRNANGHVGVCSCGAEQTQAAHTPDGNGACSVCGWTSDHADEAQFNGALLLSGVNSFTYRAESQTTHTITLTDDTRITYTDTQENYLYATETKGKERTNIVYSKNVENFIFNEGTTPPSQMQPTDHGGQSAWYYVVDGAAEYIVSYYETLGVWYQTYARTDTTFAASKQVGLSIFQNAAGKYAQFALDTASGTYKNAQPMTTEYTEVASEGWTQVNRLENMYFEFKITNGTIAWMELRATMINTCDYTTGTTVYVYEEGSLKGIKKTNRMEGTVVVRYYDINGTAVTLPSNIVLDNSVENYSCAHANVQPMERQEYFHMQACNDCGLRINFSAHDYEDGACSVCGYTCAHENISSHYESWGYNHVFYCENCNGRIEEEHTFEGNNCSKCGQTECAHTNVGSLQTNTEYHERDCSDCHTTLRERHTFDSNETCTVCGYQICHHTGERKYAGEEGRHFYICGDCEETVREDHTFNGKVCTVCGYDTTCEHTDTEWQAFSSQDCLQVCVDCGMNGGWWSNHGFQNGVCENCGYECAHGDLDTNNYDNLGYNHEVRCKTCQSMIAEAHTFEGNNCSKCGQRRCEHTGVGNVQSMGTEYHGGYCSDCEMTLRERHTFDSSETCTVCGYEICHHEGEQLYEVSEWGHSFECRTCSVTVGGEHVYGADTVCDECGFDVTCVHESYEYVPINDDNHIYVCAVCGVRSTEDFDSRHDYTDGVCGSCGHSCTHEDLYWNQNEDGCEGYCSSCGESFSQEHEYGEYTRKRAEHWHACSVCHYGYEEWLSHQFVENECSDCGWVCVHPGYNDGACNVCQTACVHVFGEYRQYGEWSGYDNYHSQHYRECQICGVEEFGDHTTTQTEYLNYEGMHAKVCDVCGLLCAVGRHCDADPIDGTCDVCGVSMAYCPSHELGNAQTHHDPQTRKTMHIRSCALCEAYVEESHTFVDGACTDCGYECVHDHGTVTTEGCDSGEHSVTCGYCGTVYEEACTMGYCHTMYADRHEWYCQYCEKEGSSAHRYEGDFCVDCGHDKACPHSNTYKNNYGDREEHEVRCNTCSLILTTEPHEYEGGQCQCGKEE